MKTLLTIPANSCWQTPCFVIPSSLSSVPSINLNIGFKYLNEALLSVSMMLNLPFVIWFSNGIGKPLELFKDQRNVDIFPRVEMCRKAEWQWLNGY